MADLVLCIESFGICRICFRKLADQGLIPGVRKAIGKGTDITMMTDPIADMLTRLRNSVSVEHPVTDVPVSKIKRGVAEVLKREGYIWDFEEIEGNPGNVLRLELKYMHNVSD